MRNTRIVAAAIKYKGVLYALAPPNRHHHIIWYIVEVTGEDSIEENLQGFINNHGRFLNRKSAKLVAERAGQILDNEAPILSELFSENLW